MRFKLFMIYTLGILTTGILKASPSWSITPPRANLGGPAIQQIEQSEAATQRIQVNVGPGRITALTWRTDEVIQALFIGDASRVTYITNAPVEAGHAKTVFLRKINPLDFPGSTQAWVTNLMVQTVDPAGDIRLYTFDVFLVDLNPAYDGVAVVENIPDSPLNLITTDAIREGLAISIERGYTPAQDPIVAKVQHVIALSTQQNLSLETAAEQAGVPINILIALNDIARTARLEQLQQGVSTSPQAVSF